MRPNVGKSSFAGRYLRIHGQITLVFLLVTVFGTLRPIQAQTPPAGLLVAQCGEFDACGQSQSVTAWSHSLNSGDLATLGLGATIPFVAGQTSQYYIRLGVTTITFTTPAGPTVETLPEFNGNLHYDPCNFCEVDTVGTIAIPGNATSATISGTFGNSVVPNSAGVNLYIGLGCAVTTGETTAFDGWDATGLTDGKWKQTLTSSSSTNFSNRTVREADAGHGVDTCWFSGSAFSPFNSITGGTWTVNTDNTWGDDFVGWFNSAVTYYRNQGRAPCGTSFLQQMTMMCPNGSFHNYGSVNTLRGSFTATTVTSGRAGLTATRRY
jgi:hypothetical protein